MKTLFAGLFCLLSGCIPALPVGRLMAQVPVISASNYFQMGKDYLRITKIDTGLNSISPGPDGTNCTWDFSSVDFDHPSVIMDTVKCISPDGTPFFGYPDTHYDTSDYCLRIRGSVIDFDDNRYMYYRFNDSSLEFIGDWADNPSNEKWYYSFTDLRTDMVFPFTYNNSNSDCFQSSFNDLSGSDWHYQTGTIEIMADGYGTLITPDDEMLLNALRIKEVIMLTDSNQLFGVNDHTYTSYYWYTSETEGPVLQFNMHETLSDLVNIAYYFKAPSSFVSSPESPAGNGLLNVFPNPANASFCIRMNDQTFQNASLTIYNSSGTIVRKLENISRNSLLIDRENLNSGCYFVELREKGIPIGRSMLLLQ